MVITTTTYAGQKTHTHVVKFSIKPSDWVHQGTGYSARSFKYEDKHLTQDKCDSGNVLIQLVGRSTSGKWPLKHIDPNYDNSGTLYYNCQPGHVDMVVYGNKPCLTYYYKMIIFSEK